MTRDRRPVVAGPLQETALARLALSYDLRLPGVTAEERASAFAAALDQIEWADRHGFGSLTLLEHHGSADGYLPSPIALAAAASQRTSRMRITVMLIAPFHEPLRTAEDLAVVDLLSRGRLSVIVAGGYLPAEFAMFGRQLSERPAAVEEMVRVLRAAWTGEPFEYRGRQVRVTPTPSRAGGPTLLVGGNSAGAARRAARLGAPFAGGGDAYEAYRQEVVALGGADPGPRPEATGPKTVHVSADPGADWLRVGPSFLHDMNEYARASAEGGLELGYALSRGVDDVRDSGQYAVLTPAETVALAQRQGGLTLNPLCGGIPPAIAWESLRLLETEVLPHLDGPSPAR